MTRSPCVVAQLSIPTWRIGSGEAAMQACAASTAICSFVCVVRCSRSIA
jgi:hypothetical protein